MTKRIMILATNGFEQSELEKPKANLEDAGFETVVVSPQSGQITGWDDKDWGQPVDVDMLLADADSADFDALLLPGGQINPDILRLEIRAVELVKEFVADAKPVAAICHGPWMLVEADVVRGRNVTGWPSVWTDLRNAGAVVVDQVVSVDGHIITSRNPGDIPAFSKALIDALQNDGEPV